MTDELRRDCPLCGRTVHRSGLMDHMRAKHHNYWWRLKQAEREREAARGMGEADCQTWGRGL